MYRKSALASYSDIDVETKTESQSPAQLVLMLFDKACVLLRQASENLAHEDIEAFDKATTHAMQIVIALRGVLDMEQGGDVAQSLYDTYTSIAASLFKAKSEKTETRSSNSIPRCRNSARRGRPFPKDSLGSLYHIERPQIFAE